MPFHTIPDTDIQYGLLSYDAHGAERTDDRDGLMSQRLLEAATEKGITDVFFFSHGWRGDARDALDQYDLWIKAVDQHHDRRRAADVFPGFRPLYIGLHWPSEPWGDEELTGDHFAPGTGFDAASLLEDYARRLGDTQAVRAALETIFDEARTDAAADRLSERARQAYLNLDQALGLGSEGVGSAPDADREPFDPDAALEAAQLDSASFGILGGFSVLLAPLRSLSYWTMKKRARTVGEGGMHAFMHALQTATAASGTRIHLMGHSFGCIVTSSMLGGSGGGQPLQRAVDSLVLVQGAVSLWSYSPDIPISRGRAGYFHRNLADGKVRGPLVTTQSRHDSAVGFFYPLASCFATEVSFAPGELPKFGAIGAYGLQGLPDAITHNLPMLSADGDYAFKRGHVYNLEASQFICKSSGVQGAHSDIAGPEVAHAIWEAALASV